MIAVGFVATVLVMAAAVPLGVRSAWRAEGRPDADRVAGLVGAGIVAWLALTGAVVASGVDLVHGTPPRFFGLILPALVTAVVLARSSLGEVVARRLPASWLVGMQAFRVPVELVLFGLYGVGLVPVHMTFEGRNPDILTGLAAAALGIALARGPVHRGVVLAWNVLGLVLLANIVSVAVMAAPGPLRSLDGAPNLVPTTFPYVWLPVFLVPLALAGHLVVFRSGLTARSSGGTAPDR